MRNHLNQHQTVAFIAFSRILVSACETAPSVFDIFGRSRGHISFSLLFPKLSPSLCIPFPSLDCSEHSEGVLTTPVQYDMYLGVCVSDYRFMTQFLLFSPPLRMWAAAALVIFTTCFTALLTSGKSPELVIECICIGGSVLKKKSSPLRKEALQQGEQRSARELAVT